MKLQIQDNDGDRKCTVLENGIEVECTTWRPADRWWLNTPAGVFLWGFHPACEQNGDPLWIPDCKATHAGYGDVELRTIDDDIIRPTTETGEHPLKFLAERYVERLEGENMEMRELLRSGKHLNKLPGKLGLANPVGHSTEQWIRVDIYSGDDGVANPVGEITWPLDEACDFSRRLCGMIAIVGGDVEAKRHLRDCSTKMHIELPEDWERLQARIDELTDGLNAEISKRHKAMVAIEDALDMGDSSVDEIVAAIKTLRSFDRMQKTDDEVKTLKDGLLDIAMALGVDRYDESGRSINTPAQIIADFEENERIRILNEQTRRDRERQAARIWPTMPENIRNVGECLSDIVGALEEIREAPRGGMDPVRIAHEAAGVLRRQYAAIKTRDEEISEMRAEYLSLSKRALDPAAFREWTSINGDLHTLASVLRFYTDEYPGLTTVQMACKVIERLRADDHWTFATRNLLDAVTLFDSCDCTTPEEIVEGATALITRLAKERHDLEPAPAAEDRPKAWPDIDAFKERAKHAVTEDDLDDLVTELICALERTKENWEIERDIANTMVQSSENANSRLNEVVDDNTLLQARIVELERELQSKAPEAKPVAAGEALIHGEDGRSVVVDVLRSYKDGPVAAFRFNLPAGVGIVKPEQAKRLADVIYANLRVEAPGNAIDRLVIMAGMREQDNDAATLHDAVRMIEIRIRDAEAQRDSKARALFAAQSALQAIARRLGVAEHDEEVGEQLVPTREELVNAADKLQARADSAEKTAATLEREKRQYSQESVCEFADRLASVAFQVTVGRYNEIAEALGVKRLGMNETAEGEHAGTIHAEIMAKLREALAPKPADELERERNHLRDELTIAKSRYDAKNLDLQGKIDSLEKDLRATEQTANALADKCNRMREESKRLHNDAEFAQQIRAQISSKLTAIAVNTIEERANRLIDDEFDGNRESELEDIVTWVPQICDEVYRLAGKLALRKQSTAVAGIEERLDAILDAVKERTNG